MTETPDTEPFTLVAVEGDALLDGKGDEEYLVDGGDEK
jgi:hypothetical protein